VRGVGFEPYRTGGGVFHLAPAPPLTRRGKPAARQASFPGTEVQHRGEFPMAILPGAASRDETTFPGTERPRTARPPVRRAKSASRKREFPGTAPLARPLRPL
jgi:hypothetical protein